MIRRRHDELDCTRALALIDEHVEDRPSEAPTAELAAHIDSCDTCRAEFELAESIRREMSRLPQFDMPDRVIEAARPWTHDRTELRVPARPGGWRLPAWASLAAAAVVAVTVTIVLTGPVRREDPASIPHTEVARATAEAKLAFALIADATQRAEHELRDSVLRERVLATAVRGVSRSFRLRSRLGQSLSSDPTPTDQSGGST